MIRRSNCVLFDAGEDIAGCGTAAAAAVLVADTDWADDDTASGFGVPGSSLGTTTGAVFTTAAAAAAAAAAFAFSHVRKYLSTIC